MAGPFKDMVQPLDGAPFFEDLLEGLQFHFADIMTCGSGGTNGAMVLDHDKPLAFPTVFGQVTVARAELGELAHFGFQSFLLFQDIIIA